MAQYRHMTIQAVPGIVPQMHVGDRCRKAREVLGEDRQTFAETIGVSSKTLTRYEGGQVAPRQIVLKAIAFATGVDLEWLRTGVPSRPIGGGSTFVLSAVPRTRLELVTYGLRGRHADLIRADVAA